MYTTVSGDTWDIISNKNYGSTKYIKELIRANLNYINTVIFSAGIQISIPVIEIKDTPLEKPPWRR